MTIAVQFIDVSRTFGDVRAVDRVSIDIQDGEFFSMLGPSGSGKTTCLRLIAGFEQLTSGSIRIHGRSRQPAAVSARREHRVSGLRAVPAHVGAGKRRLRPDGEGRRQTRAAGAGARGAGERGARFRCRTQAGAPVGRPAAARGVGTRAGQSAAGAAAGRTARRAGSQAARADAGRAEEAAAPAGHHFIFVTHDQSEALSMSDRVAVFNNGRIEQVDTPRELYMRPKTPFVAEFVGTSNVVRSELAQRLLGESRTFSIRPEHIRLLEHGGAAQDEIRTGHAAGNPLPWRGHAV